MPFAANCKQSVNDRDGPPTGLSDGQVIRTERLDVRPGLRRQGLDIGTVQFRYALLQIQLELVGCETQEHIVIFERSERSFHA